MDTLTLPEYLLLLALKDEKGTVVYSSELALPFGLNGALLLELSLRQRVRVEEELLVELSAEATGDAILDEALKSLDVCERDKSAAYWVARPDGLVKNLKQRLLDRLVDRGILRKEEKRLLWLIRLERFPEVDGQSEQTMRKRIHDVLFHGAEADEAAALLIGLIHACDLVREVFPDEDAEVAKTKLKSFSEGNLIAEAVSIEVADASIQDVFKSVMTSIASALAAS